MRHDGLRSYAEVLACDLIVRQNTGCNIGHQSVDNGNNDAGHDDAHRDRALGVLRDRYNTDRSHGSSLAGPSHDGDRADHTAETAVEEAAVKCRIEEIRSVYARDTHDDEQDEGDDQKPGRNILEERYDPVSSDREKEEQCQNNSTDQCVVFVDDREQIPEVTGKCQCVSGEAEGPDDIGPPAVTGEQGRQQHSLHAVVTAVDDEDAGHAEVVPVGKQHVEYADNGDGKDGPSRSLDGRTKCDEDAGTDGASDAQADDVPQPDLFDVFVIHFFLRFTCQPRTLTGGILLRSGRAAHLYGFIIQNGPERSKGAAFLYRKPILCYCFFRIENRAFFHDL